MSYAPFRLRATASACAQRALAIAAFSIIGTAPILLSAPAHAQEFRGTLSGAVTDSTGAVIPGATVVVRETRTGTINTTKSDTAGQYVVPFLLPGNYEISVTMPGFEKALRAGITLQSQEHPIINLALTVGGTDQTVTVTSAAPILDQANASVGQVISTESVADLPLNGRTPTTLTELSEGVITTAAPQIVHPFDNNAGNSWSIGGTPNQVSEVLLDGSPDLTLLGALAYAPTQDSVQEVSIRPFDTDASFGHTIGGVINQITKSGTNRLHGTVYEFGQIAAIDADLYFNDRANPVVKTPVAHFNQYGLTVGGPIVIPKVFNGRDKLFFFFAYEGLKDSTPATTALTVPTPAEDAGDFSQLLTAACLGGKGGPYTVNATSGVAYCNDTPTTPNPNQLYNPYTGTLNAKGQITRTAIANNNLASIQKVNPIAAKYLALYPAPNTTSGVLPDGLDNYISPAPSADTYNNQFGRIDLNAGARDHLFFDFRHNARTQVKNNYFGNNTTGTTLTRENFGLSIDDVYTLNPTTIVDARVNWTLFNEVHGTPAQAYSPATVGLPSAQQAEASEVQLPCINFTTSSSIGTCSPSTTTFAALGDNTSAFDPTTSYQVFTDVVKVLGRNTLKVGFDGRQYRISIENFGNADGSLGFGGNDFVNSGTSSVTFGGDLANLWLGLPTTGQYDIPARSDYHQYYIGSFVQDDFRVNNKLTFNFGVRFDIDTPFRDKFGRTVSGFNPTAPNSASSAQLAGPVTVSSNGVSATVPSINSLGGLTFPSGTNGAVYNTNSGFLSPRFGFSFSPDSKTVLRGGFGIFVQPETLASLASTGTYSSNAINNQEGFSATTNYAATTNSFLTPNSATGLSNPFPTALIQPSGSSLGASTFLGSSVSFLAPNEHDPYAERYNLGFQRSLSSRNLIEVLYQGNHALHLPVASQNINATLPQYLSYTPYRNEALALAYATNNVANPFAGKLPNASSLNGSTTGFSNLIVPFPQFGTNAVTEQNETIGQSYFNSAIIHFEQRASHGLTLTANYSFSKLIEADTRLNDEDTFLTRRISPFDHTHHFTVGSTYDLPVGRGRQFNLGNNRFLDEIFGGYTVNAIYQFQTGAPIYFSADIPLQPGVNLRQITNQTRNTSPTSSNTPALSVQDFVTGSATTCPTSGACDGSSFINGQYTFHYRTLPQTLSWVRQDGFNNLDASVLKNFNITEKAFVQLRFETFNTLNHPIFAAPNVSSATASNFGYITAVASNSQPRQIQLGARIVF